MSNQTLLTPLEAYDAMFAFLDAYWQRGGRSSDDIAAMLGTMNRTTFFSDRRQTADPAQWDDWVAAIEAVKRKQH
jgi:hypothetical protein